MNNLSLLNQEQGQARRNKQEPKNLSSAEEREVVPPTPNLVNVDLNL